MVAVGMLIEPALTDDSSPYETGKSTLVATGAASLARQCVLRQ
jgi:hypothetical protein